MVAHPFESIDLFCGAGGLSLGLRAAGFRTRLACDSWSPAVQTYRLNFSGVRVFDGNLAEVSGPALLRLADSNAAPDLIAGGPPCQGFSSAGSRRARDSRNSLVGQFSRLVAEVRPRAFLFENVEGFLTTGNGAFVLELLDPLIEAGYRIHLRKVNVANFGVAQHRKRVIGMGCIGADPVFPEATHRASGAPGAERVGSSGLPDAPSLREALLGLPTPSESEAEASPPEHFAVRPSDADLARIRLLRPGQTMRDLPEALRHPSYERRAKRRVLDGTPSEKRGGAPAGVRRLRFGEPSKAITGAATREFVHPTAHRPLTLRECARIQSFPDTFQFAGSKADRNVLLGNAVPPTFAAVLGSAMARTLAKEATGDTKGRLLSFEPTTGSGVSPALGKVLRTVLARFGRNRQLALGAAWD